MKKEKMRRANINYDEKIDIVGKAGQTELAKRYNTTPSI